jgi:hypothetical protein
VAALPGGGVGVRAPARRRRRARAAVGVERRGTRCRASRRRQRLDPRRRHDAAGGQAAGQRDARGDRGAAGRGRDVRLWRARHVAGGRPRQ